VADVGRFEEELLEFMRTRHAGLLQEIRTSGVPDSLDDIVQSFKDSFVAASAASGVNTDPAAVDADEVGDANSDKTLATE